MIELLSESTSVWQVLKQCNKPILIYGMGDGALKIMRVFEVYNIKISGFFASDEFVRGHSFCGFKVLTYAQACQQFSDFVIVLAFAGFREPLLSHIKKLNTEHEFFAPDVPVIMESCEIFDYNYVLKHKDKLTLVYNSLQDDLSRKTFINTINFKISGKIDYLFEIFSPTEEVYQNIIKVSKGEVYVDLGAYNGDTLTQFLSHSRNIKTKAICFEPDKKNYKKLLQTVQTLGINDCECFNIGAWDCQTTLMFANKAGRNSSIAKTGQVPVIVNSVDNILEGAQATTIKFDVEGAEQKAVLGASKTITKYKPKLMVSAYHKNEDIYELPLLIKKLNPEYKLFLRHHPYIPAWETNFYAV